MIFRRIPVVVQPVLEFHLFESEIKILRRIFNHNANRDNVESDKILFNCLTDDDRRFVNAMHEILNREQ